ncbi:hypothetical protein IT568_10220 [bacterium]|nr:hypothetical protein [bacterium]
MKKKLLLTTVFIGLSASGLFAGAWTQPKNNFYFKVGLVSSQASEQFTNKGKTKKLVSENEAYKNKELGATAYLEYGITSWLTGIASFPVKSIQSDTKSFLRESKGVSDLVFSGKVLLNHFFNLKKIVLANQLTVKIPTGYDNTNTPALGSGQTDFDLKILAGGSFHPVPLYASGEIGFRYRTDFPANEIPYAAEIGYTFQKRFLIRGIVDGVFSLGNTDEAFDPSTLSQGKPYFPEAVSYLRTGPSLIFVIKPFLEANIDFTTVVLGKNTLKSREWSFGLAYKFNPKGRKNG